MRLTLSAAQQQRWRCQACLQYTERRRMGLVAHRKHPFVNLDNNYSSKICKNLRRCTLHNERNWIVFLSQNNAVIEIYDNS